MIHEILGLLIEFAVQTVFLTAALWIMIKLQKLDYNFPGLLGSAALACGVDAVLTLILQRWFDGMTMYLTTPIFIVVLFLCIRKVTNADPVDVSFTIVVGGALRFGMNLWLIGALMGNLRPSAGNSEKFDTVSPQAETNEVYQPAIKTNRPAPSASTNSAVQPGLAKPAEETTNLFSVKGVTQSASRSAVTIQTGTRTYTIFLGESALTQTINGPVSVRFKEVGNGWVVLTINGQETKLPFH